MFMDKKKTFDFASIWLMRFESRELSRFQFEDLFGEDCRELGFEMDCAHEFEEQYPGCFNIPNEKLDGVPQSGSLVAKFSNVHEKNPPVAVVFCRVQPSVPVRSVRQVSVPACSCRRFC